MTHTAHQHAIEVVGRGAAIATDLNLTALASSLDKLNAALFEDEKTMGASPSIVDEAVSQKAVIDAHSAVIGELLLVAAQIPAEHHALCREVSDAVHTALID